MPLFVIIGAAFIAWLMWSSKADKELFLGLAWSLMMGVGLISLLWQIFSR